jgi:hypothetical protein
MDGSLKKGSFVYKGFLQFNNLKQSKKVFVSYRYSSLLGVFDPIPAIPKKMAETHK